MNRHSERVTVTIDDTKDSVNYSIASSLSADDVDKVSHTSEEFQRFSELTNDGWQSRRNYLWCCSLISVSMFAMPVTLELILSYSGSVYFLLFVVIALGFAVPVVYTEIFIGRYARVTNCQLYRMAPLFFGFCLYLLILNFAYYAFTVTKTSQFFVLMVSLMTNVRSLRNCEDNDGTCYNYRINGSLINEHCEGKGFNLKCNISGLVRYPMMLNYWFLYNCPDDSHYPYSQLVVGVVIGWSVILAAIFKGIDTLAVLVKYTAFSQIGMLTLIIVLGMTKQGDLAFVSLLEYREPTITGVNFMLLAFNVLLKFGLITPTGHASFSAYVKFSSNPASDILIIAFQITVLTAYYVLAFMSACSVIAEAMGVKIDNIYMYGFGIYLVMLPEFFFCMEMPTIFIVTFYLTLWFFEIFKTALFVHFLILNFCDYFPRIKKYTSYVWCVACFCMLLISVLLCTKFSMKNVIPPTYMVYMSYGFAVFLAFETTMICYVYGYQRLSDDIYFTTGVKPSMAWRLIWMICPIVSWMAALYTGYQFLRNALVDEFLKSQLLVTYLVWGFALLIIILATVMFIALKCGKPNLCEYLIKPQYFWGPPDSLSRKNRKCFSPETAIRSQPYTYIRVKGFTLPSQIYDYKQIHTQINLSKQDILNNEVFFNKIGIYRPLKTMSTVENDKKNY